MADTAQQADKFTLPKGTIIKISGLPFELMNDTVISGNAENYKLALNQQ